MQIPSFYLELNLKAIQRTSLATDFFLIKTPLIKIRYSFQVRNQFGSILVADNHPLTGRYTGINKPARWICLGQTLC
jgi:hypothetical protein